MVARGKVRYVGEPVAAVAARSTPRRPRRAAAAIEVDYEPLPAVLSIDAALAPGRTARARGLRRLRQDRRRRRPRQRLFESDVAEGDVDRAFARMRRGRRGHVRDAGAASRLPGDRTAASPTSTRAGRITLYASCQSVHHVQQRVAEELGEPMSRMRVIATRVGGGFGGKHASNIHSIAAWLARAARRPVKLVLSRKQDFEMQRSRHPARIWMKTGARRDGTMLARDVRITLDGGAYADESPPVLAFALLMSRGPYRIPNVRARGQAVYTNKLRAGSFRGFGNPQATFAGESQIDELAACARHRSGRAAPAERDARRATPRSAASAVRVLRARRMR